MELNSSMTFLFGFLTAGFIVFLKQVSTHELNLSEKRSTSYLNFLLQLNDFYNKITEEKYENLKRAEMEAFLFATKETSKSMSNICAQVDRVYNNNNITQNPINFNEVKLDYFKMILCMKKDVNRTFLKPKLKIHHVLPIMPLGNLKTNDD